MDRMDDYIEFYTIIPGVGEHYFLGKSLPSGDCIAARVPGGIQALRSPPCTYRIIKTDRKTIISIQFTCILIRK